MKLKTAFSLGLIALSFFGCAQKKEISNQTALFWHKNIQKDLSHLNIDKADNDFTSLELEHPNSKFIPVDLLVLFNAHYKNEEYELAKFYLNEYKKRYANKYEKEWCDYMNIKIDFFSITNPYTNQKKVDDLLIKTKNIIKKYPNSVYNYELNTIKTKLTITQKLFKNQIANLYKKLDKPNATNLYKTDIDKNVIPPHIPWYKQLFYW